MTEEVLKMKMYDVRCPVCGTVNRNLYLEETDGLMECEHCQRVVQVMGLAEEVKTRENAASCRILEEKNKTADCRMVYRVAV